MTSPSIQTQAKLFYKGLTLAIPPKSQSNRTSFGNITNWLITEIDSGRFKDTVFKRVLGYAKEAAQPSSRNPAAVFTYILKSDLGYQSQLEKQQQAEHKPILHRITNNLQKSAKAVFKNF